MSGNYVAVQWNRQKRFYDGALILGVALYLVLFEVLNKVFFPLVTDEILLMRAFGTAALILLHVILCIGPLCRLHRGLLPLLYNRRHAGVTLFVLALAHAVLVVLTYHVGGDANPFVTILTGGGWAPSMVGVPFQALGFTALVILFLMAATSHDFWLANLTAPVWKALHMLVYVAYGLLVLHVSFGVLQAEVNPIYAGLLATGGVVVVGLHWRAGRGEVAADRPAAGTVDAEGYVDAGPVADIPEGRARVVCLTGERVAIFRYEGKVSAISNVCQHQNGPLGEGKIVYGCVTCPWHGYQYQPESGAAPPPFVERVPTFNVRVRGGRVWVHARPNPPGTVVEPARWPEGGKP